MSKSKSTREEKEHQQLMRLAMSARDFRHALSAATFLTEECDWIKSYSNAESRKFHCYETTMVVAYGRPFVQSRGQVAPPFNWNMVPESLNFEENEVDQIHRMLWKIRHHVDTALQAHPASRDGLPVIAIG